MSRAKGNRAPQWVAEYLRTWWPHVEKTPNSLPGPDLTGLPGITVEIKTGVNWRTAWLEQARKYARNGELPLLIYVPPGCGERSIADALVILSLREVMDLLVEAGYAPPPSKEP